MVLSSLVGLMVVTLVDSKGDPSTYSLLSLIDSQNTQGPHFTFPHLKRFVDFGSPSVSSYSLGHLGYYPPRLATPHHLFPSSHQPFTELPRTYANLNHIQKNKQSIKAVTPTKAYKDIKKGVIGLKPRKLLSSPKVTKPVSFSRPKGVKQLVSAPKEPKPTAGFSLYDALRKRANMKEPPEQVVKNADLQRPKQIFVNEVFDNSLEEFSVDLHPEEELANMGCRDVNC